MDRDIYLIAWMDDRWILHLNGEALETFSDDGRAARAAFAAARISRRRGRSAEIFAVDQSGGVYPIQAAA